MSLFAVVAIFYASVSVVTLGAYAWDKYASKRAGSPRIRERTLHLWSLAGGFVGAGLGQLWLRHKTRHPAFAIIALIAAGLHGGLWAWWFSQ